MQSIIAIDDLRSDLRARRARGQRIALVPTMGNLHQGHLDLVHAARQACDCVVASVFVNPLQFGPSEDFSRYPRSPEEDARKLREAGCDLLFAPTVAELYPRGLERHTVVFVPELSELHCGASRPGHFKGVATVVCKLFNLVAPDEAFFGLKDYQQLLIIRHMAADLCLPLRINGIPTRREASGLALSSRNGYLDAEERQTAPGLYAALRALAQAIEDGDRQYSVLENEARAALEGSGWRIDYLTICQAASLLPATPLDHELVILAAAWLGRTRLIDNLTLTLPSQENAQA